MPFRKLLKLGWEEWLSLPELSIPAIKAKVDTGAKTSALHAYRIEPFMEDGKQRVRFAVQPLPERPEIHVVAEADLVDRRWITSSNGEMEERFIIKTKVKVGKKIWPIEMSLTNRETMMFRMLLGRSAIEDRAFVNPNLSFVNGELSPELYDRQHVTIKREGKLKIAVLTREPNAYSHQRLMEAAELRGHYIRTIDTLRCYMRISDSPEIHYHGEKLEDFHAVIPRIGASISFYGSAVVRQFEIMGIHCLNSSVAIMRSRDKLRAHQLLVRKGIPIPTTGFAHSPNDTHDLIRLVDKPPLVIKLLEGTQGRGVLLAESEKSAQSVIDAFKDVQANILVQEFVKEAEGADIRCLVLGKKVIAAMQRKAADGDFRSNLHRGGKASLVEITKEERKIAIKAAQLMGLHFAGVDILRSKEGPKVIEINSSPGLEGIEKSTGLDIAGMVIEYLEKNAYPLKNVIKKSDMV